MPSVVICAHNEEAVIGACIDALSAQTPRPEIIVSANGCTDRTLAEAASREVVVVDRREPGKPGALNAGDAAATTFPRVYLDADIVAPPGAIAVLQAALERGALVAVPARRMETAGRPWPVRAYLAINTRLPAFRTGLFGRGMIAVSEAGRARFGEFPPVVADDLYLDALYSPEERTVVADVEVVVQAPYTTSELLNRLARVRRGNEQLRAALRDRDDAAVRASDRWAWLRDVVVPRPWLAPAAVPYVVITMMAARRARRGDAGWGKDQSTRIARTDAP